MRFEPVPALVGHIAVPGDKSISHRAVLIGAVCEGETVIRGFGRSADTEATLDAVRALGVRVDELDDDTLVVGGVGLRGLAPPSDPLNCRNAGTLMRLLPGILAGQSGGFELVGDASLSSRPMERVAEPLRRMGVSVETTDGYAPIRVVGGAVSPTTYEVPVASAQIKSVVLLAGLFARGGETTVVERLPTRDHTERLLGRAGARLRIGPRRVSVWPAEQLALGEIEIPGDFSSAAPFLVAAAIVPGSDVTVHGVGLNPRRTGLLDVLERMGARVAVYNRRAIGGEPAGDVEVRAAPLVAATIARDEVPGMIDELPVFALAACHARGDSVVRGAGELRVKESDRIDALATGLKGIGAHIRATRDGFKVRGVPTRLRGGTFDAQGDHRLAMVGAIAGVSSAGGVELDGAEALDVSFPGFLDVLSGLETRLGAGD